MMRFKTVLIERRPETPLAVTVSQLAQHALAAEAAAALRQFLKTWNFARQVDRDGRSRDHWSCDYVDAMEQHLAHTKFDAHLDYWVASVDADHSVMLHGERQWWALFIYDSSVQSELEAYAVATMARPK